MLKLEGELLTFVNSTEDPKPPILVLPPRSSYQRQIAYRLSARFKLQKATPAQEKEALAAAGMGDGDEKKASTANGGEITNDHLFLVHTYTNISLQTFCYTVSMFRVFYVLCFILRSVVGQNQSGGPGASVFPSRAAARAAHKRVMTFDL